MIGSRPSASDAMTEVVDDDAFWIGALMGAASVLLALGLLKLRGRICWVPRVGPEVARTSSLGSTRRRISGILGRALSGTLDEGEIWYDALEEQFPGPAAVVDFASRAGPWLLCGKAGSGVDGASPTSRLRLHKICGTSVPMVAPEEASSDCPSWSHGDSRNFKVRRGPDYPTNGFKDASSPALYTCVGMDVVAAGCLIEQAIPRLGPLPAGGEGWHVGLRVPRVLIINCQLPFQEGPKLFGAHPEDDGGVSVVMQYVASPELIKLASSNGEAPAGDPDFAERWPAVRLLQGFFKRGGLELPNKERTSNNSAGALKAIGWMENLAEVQMPRLARGPVEKYNAKPVLLSEHYAKLFTDPNGEYMEIDFDIRKFSWPTRRALCSLRDKSKEMTGQVGFVLQGAEDEDLPEVLLSLLRVQGIDLNRSAWIIDPRAPEHRRYVGATSPQ